jgi:hypothetical protein
MDETCQETHPVVKLPCIKKGAHTVHKAERDKPDRIYKTHRAKDVWLWWEGAWERKGILTDGEG